MSGTWPSRFESVLRQYLPLLGDDERLAPDTWLTDLGLDSLGVVSLLSELADGFGLVLDEESLDPALFATPASLWAAVAAAPAGRSR
jgi:acyl carrier protein